MKRTEILVIGGGQAGLSMSHCLADRGIDHVVLERGRVGERWRNERWDSLRLLTPKWQSRLPGWSYAGPDPDGFMTKTEVVGYLEAYARSFSAPVVSGVSVKSVEREGPGFRVEADGGTWHAGGVVVATGNCDRPHVPRFAEGIPAGLTQVTPTAYRNADGLPPGGVLVVGASATGVQLAQEIRRSGRRVTLAVGRHTRMPRRYRGRDIEAWLDAIGLWNERIDDPRKRAAARHDPSLQLVGSADPRSLDLGVLQEEGVRLVGRALDAEGGRVALSQDLADSIRAADSRLERLLARIDGHIDRAGRSAELPAGEPPGAIRVPPSPTSLDLEREGIETVVWATGYRRDYPWLRVPVLDAAGEIRHEEGVTPEPGLYVLGLPFLRTRGSGLLDGVGADAAFLADRIASSRRAVHSTAA